MPDNVPSACLRCGRPLTARESLQRGVGSRCGRLVQLTASAVLAAASPAAVDRALQLITDGGIVPTRGPALAWTTVSSDGTTRYRTSATACTCAAGVHGRDCYHRLAVRLLAP